MAAVGMAGSLCSPALRRRMAGSLCSPALRRRRGGLVLELKVYFDYKSPFTYLAMEPAFALPQRFDVQLRFLPFALRIKGPGERSIYSEWKARYSYLDARRWANRRGGFRIRGPRKIYDSSPALIGPPSFAPCHAS